MMEFVACLEAIARDTGITRRQERLNVVENLNDDPWLV